MDGVANRAFGMTCAPVSRSASVSAELENSLRAALGVECRARGRAQGELVPESVLSRTDGFVKPRSLFDADEDWDRAFD